MTKAVGKVQDVANGFVNASDFSNMPEPIIGADADPQSMMALGKSVMKVAEFAGEIFGTVIEPAANAIGTKVRRVLRDDIGISQAKAQDIGDITHVVAGILIPGGTAKVISKTGKLTSFGKAVEETGIFEVNYKSSFNTALKHRTVLAFEEAGILTKDGLLTEKAIREAKVVPLKTVENPEGIIGNDTIIKVLTADGSNIVDWNKYKTKSINMHTGERRQIHFYMNPKTRKVDYSTLDFKVKSDIALDPKLRSEKK